VEQLHKIFKLCGSPSEEYWKKSKLPHATIFKPQQSYKRCIAETFKDFPPSSLPLIETLLAIDPAERRTATAALRSEVSLCSIIHYYIFSSAASSSTIFYRDVYELGHLIENVLLWLLVTFTLRHTAVHNLLAVYYFSGLSLVSSLLFKLCYLDMI
jgi:serine/threonine protein kinase